VVTPSTYGTDNRCTLDALAQLGPDARGVAVVDAEVSEAEIDELASHGIRGLRVNFVTPQTWGVTTPEMLITLASKATRLGWHIQVLLHPEQLVELAPVIKHLPAPLVVDHLGRIDPAEGSTAQAFRLLMPLLEAGNTWIKLSAAYMRSSVGGPSYVDTVPLGQALV